VTPKEIVRKTKYAGTLTIAMDQVASFATERPLTTQLTDSTTVTGITLLDEQKTVRVHRQKGTSKRGLQFVCRPDSYANVGLAHDLQDPKFAREFLLGAVEHLREPAERPPSHRC
jgi:hypothetical protein